QGRKFMDEKNKPEEIKDFILKYISKKGKLPKDIDVDKFNYIDTGYIDSMGLIKFVVELEQKFDVQITDDDMILPEFRTIGGLVESIKRKTV
ncbi:MAG: acyl carrier protein, partial [bacterium]